MRSLIALFCLAALAACDDRKPAPPGPSAEGEVVGAASVQIGAALAVDNQRTLHATSASGAVVSTNPNGRLVAIIAD